jgi:hypothetical protein
MSSADRGWKELGDDAAWEALLSAKAYSRARAKLQNLSSGSFVWSGCAVNWRGGGLWLQIAASTALVSSFFATIGSEVVYLPSEPELAYYVKLYLKEEFLFLCRMSKSPLSLPASGREISCGRRVPRISQDLALCLMLQIRLIYVCCYFLSLENRYHQALGSCDLRREMPSICSERC